MPHALILGMTQSGKTTLAKKLCARYKSAGVGTIVLDPLSDPEWDCEFRTTNPEEFLDVFWDSRQCAVFIDEAGDCVGKFDKLMQRTATRGRHWGHRCHYLSQRGTQLNRTVRDQCVHLFLFATALEDVKVHAREWNNRDLLEVAQFQPGEFYHATRFGKAQKGDAFAD